MADKKLTTEDVAERVRAIAAMADDDEAAHSSEDSLWGDVLTSIAAGVEDPSALARAALKTQAIKFSRWCA